MKKVKSEILILILVLYLLFIFLSLHVSQAYTLYIHEGFNKIMSEVITRIETAPFQIDTSQVNLKFMGIISMAYFIGILIYLTSRKNFMFGREHGSASWAARNDAKKITDKDEHNNIIFTRTEQMSLNTHMTRKNLNILVVGGSGSGKTRFFAKPNLMQLNTSYVVTDSKGDLMRSTGKMLEEAGYKVKVFNLIEMQYSNCYNPFDYIREDKDVLKLINNMIKNTNPRGQHSSAEPFWEKSETALLQALCYYLYYEAPKDEQNFTMIMEMIRSAEVKEDEEFESALDILFKTLQEDNPDHIAVKQYAIFKQAAGKTAKSILVSVGVRLSAFNTKDVAALTLKDNIQLCDIGTEKTVLFVVIPDSDDTFNFLVAMMYSQIFDSLYYRADFEFGGRLPIHVRLILDEFANIGQIPNFDKLVATMRSREISVSIIIQNLAQLKSLYKDTWESITGNCVRP